MRRLLSAAGALAAALLLAGSPVDARTVRNPDQITVYFPTFEGEGNLGRNVATVLSLQLAQTTRRRPWPDNPEGHDFGEGMIRWSLLSLDGRTHAAAEAAGQAIDLLAQIVIWGRTRRYAGDVIADVNVTLPRYAPAGACGAGAPPCDFRRRNFERWEIGTAAGRLAVEPPGRRFTFTGIRLLPSVVERFSVAEGLPIRASREGGETLGVTGTELRFIEFNRNLPGAPTKLRSNGVTGYVALPELSDRGSEFADMVGGILQVFRGDWSAADSSFERVIANPGVRAPLRVTALLYRGMARAQGSRDGMPAFREALRLAPYDRRAVQYAVMGLVARGGANDQAEAGRLLADKAFLFAADDPWLAAARRVVGTP